MQDIAGGSSANWRADVNGSVE